MPLKTNGPDQRDCDDCGKPVGNRPRVTLESEKVICLQCCAARGGIR